MDIETLNNNLSRKFRGASLDDVQGITNFSIYGEAASNLTSRLDPQETMRLYRFDVFQDIRDYGAPDDLKGKKVVDPAPQDQRNGEEFSQTFLKEFRRDEEFGKVNVGFLDGEKILRVATSGKGSSTIGQTADAADWAGSGGASTPIVDEVVRMDNSDTIRFNLGAAGGTVTGNFDDEVDVSEHEDIGSFFLKIYFPSTPSITSITLRVGSSATAYWSMTGVAHTGSFKKGVNIVRFDWSGATEVLVPSSAAVDYEQLIFVTTAALTGVRIAPLTSKLPWPFETPYYSNCIFTDVDGNTWKDIPTVTTDLIVLEKEAQNIFFYECCMLIAEDLTLDDEATKFKFKLYGDPQKANDNGGLYAQYEKDKPAESLQPHSYYMKFRNRSVRNRRGILRE
jgi:hypothetical protein